MASNVDYKKAFETLIGVIQFERELWQETVDMDSECQDVALEKYDFAEADYHWRMLVKHKELRDLCDKLLLEADYIRIKPVYDAAKVHMIALDL